MPGLQTMTISFPTYIGCVSFTVALLLGARNSAEYYPLSSPLSWVYETDLGGSMMTVILTNDSPDAATSPSQSASVGGKLIERKLFEVTPKGIWLKSLIRNGKSEAMTPRPILLYPVAEHPRWEGEIEQVLACSTPARGTMQVSVEGMDTVRFNDTDREAVRVRSTATFQETCGTAGSPLTVSYSDTSWYIHGVGLFRSSIVIKTPFGSSQRTIQLLKHSVRQPSGRK
jgi:hypothetical protein